MYVLVSDGDDESSAAGIIPFLKGSGGQKSFVFFFPSLNATASKEILVILQF